MTRTAKDNRIEELIDNASKALNQKKWFDAERLAITALAEARESHQFDKMAEVLKPLREARRQRFDHAVAPEKVFSITTNPITEDMKVKRGCFVVGPPQVGADARRLRQAAFEQGVAVVTICREPVTQIGLLPIVSIAPGLTLRARIDPPEDLEYPDIDWFLDAYEMLGDWAIETLDPELPVSRRIDALLDRIVAMPEHENLHLALESACREAHRLKVAGELDAAST